MNTAYDNKKKRVVIIFIITLLSGFFLFARASFAVPNAVNALDIERSSWRNYYRDKFFIDMHSFTVMSTLLEYNTQDLDIKRAIKLRLEGKWKESVDILRDLASKPDISNIDEVIYASGLVYESLAFFPEAMGNYERIKYKKGKDKADAYHRTILRKSYVKFINALKYDSLINMIDADGGFYKVFRKSSQTSDWKDALAGHAVMLYYFGAHKNAEEIFKVVAKAGKLRPAYLFARAENFMSLGLHQNARATFQSLQDFFKESSRLDLLSYMYLRLGDIASMRDEISDAKAYYDLIPVYPDESQAITLDEPFIMQTMASAELLMRTGKNKEAIGLLRYISKGPFPIGLDIRETIKLDLVILYDREKMLDKAFYGAKEFVLLYPKNPYIPKIKKMINDHLYNVFSQSYKDNNYNTILYNYFESIRFVTERRSLLIVTDALLKTGFPDEALSAYYYMWTRHSNYKDIDLVAGLAKSYVALDDGLQARSYLKKAKPQSERQKKQLAQAWRSLGDYYYRVKKRSDAIRAYANAVAYIKNDALKLRYASLLYQDAKFNKALHYYKLLVMGKTPKELKIVAYIGAGDSYLALNNSKRALINFNLALKNAPVERLAEVYYKIGEANYALSRGDNATKAWKKAVKNAKSVFYKKLAQGRLREMDLWKSARM